MLHRYQMKGLNFILDVNSGAVHVVDDLAYEMSSLLVTPMPQNCPESVLKALGGKYDTKEIYNAYDELFGLYQEGMLFSEDHLIAPDKIMPNEFLVKALCLHVSHDCNLRCQYCFASTGDFGTGRKIMPFSVAKDAIDFVIQNSGARKNIEIDFFGGEPLMAFETVKQTVEYAKKQGALNQKQFRFTITTNGLLLDDEKIDYINREMDNVVLSLDGTKEVNDTLRKTVDGRGSYDIIVPKMQKLVKRRDKDKSYYVRGTFTKNNLNFTKDILAIADLGFDQISVEPVTLKADNALSLSQEDLPTIYSEYEKLCDIILAREKEGKWFNFFHFMVDLEQGPCIIKRMRGCGAGGEYLAITPEGDVYPCHQFVGNEKYKIGNLNKQNNFRIEIIKRFSNISVLTREKCQNCWAKYYCSGGCSASNLLMNGTIDEPYELGCEMQRKRLECAIYLKAVQ